uniref:HAD family phosphatase n=1 Tax=Panagrolaimus davidi TaxID=227884 RepID=A0A914PD99_9BILA
MVVAGKYKAVISDMGGVILKFSDPKLIEKMMVKAKGNKKLQKLLEDFELGHSGVESLGPLIADLPEMDVQKEVLTLIQGLQSSVGTTDESVVSALKKLKESGFKIALLTNNGWIDDTKTKSMIPCDTEYFDVIVESCRVNMRKPFPDIYQLTLEKLELKPEECIFIDDLKMNCEAAEKLGIKSIQVINGDSETALKELEELTKIKLL